MFAVDSRERAVGKSPRGGVEGMDFK